MNKQIDPSLKELFKQASEIAQQVPENLQEAAFNKAIDLLAAEVQPDSVASKSACIPVRREKASANSTIAAGAFSVDELISLIDSTQHPGISSATKALDRALLILQIALSNHDVDGLTPSEIAKILTDKFRISTSAASVSMALGKVTDLVNRVPDGQGFRYRIMDAGGEYLARLGEAPSSHATAATPRKVAKKGAAKRVRASDAASPSDQKNKTRKSTQNSCGKGPKSAVLGLIESGFFSKARTGLEVQTYLDKKRGLKFGTSQLRLVMLRFVRDEKLDRDENAEGQYEYKAP